MSEAAKDVFVISEREGENKEGSKNIWTKIGVAFVNRDQSLNVILDAIPLHGKLHIRDKKIAK